MGRPTIIRMTGGWIECIADSSGLDISMPTWKTVPTVLTHSTVAFADQTCVPFARPNLNWTKPSRHPSDRTTDLTRVRLTPLPVDACLTARTTDMVEWYDDMPTPVTGYEGSIYLTEHRLRPKTITSELAVLTQRIRR
ncbi:hypothetical protein B296_00058942 [Ensete ventricosum]|uniref:Uncharacterized protein n=1 Tax=Ensete ventricosum TaxID=4639 RepID=A0A426X511_ENSVE|nr:hypothetical protein B296_00058942 [Ensete ventricosum]